MKRVTLVYKAYEEGENWTECHDALLVKDNIVIRHGSLGGSDYILDVTISDKPFKVDSNGCVHYEFGKQCSGVEIPLSEEGRALDLEDIANMTFAELSQYLGFPR